MGLLCVIPYLGVWLGLAAPVILLTTLHLEYGQSYDSISIYLIGIIIILMLNAVEQVIEMSLIQPRIFGDQVHIHPLAVFSSFIFFGAIFLICRFITCNPNCRNIESYIQICKRNKSF